jgi:hypothetical protein
VQVFKSTNRSIERLAGNDIKRSSFVPADVALSDVTVATMLAYAVLQGFRRRDGAVVRDCVLRPPNTPTAYVVDRSGTLL